MSHFTLHYTFIYTWGELVHVASQTRCRCVFSFLVRTLDSSADLCDPAIGLFYVHVRPWCVLLCWAQSLCRGLRSKLSHVTQVAWRQALSREHFHIKMRRYPPHRWFMFGSQWVRHSGALSLFSEVHFCSLRCALHHSSPCGQIKLAEQSETHYLN